MIVSAPAKIILSGEHAVIYGYPALAGALSLRLTLLSNKKPPETELTSVSSALQSLQAKVESTIPRGCGLGSSAALSVAIAAAWQGSTKNRDVIAHKAWKLEQEFHGKSSGIDPTTSTFGGLLWYRRETPHLAIKHSLPISELHFAVLHTGKPAESTGDMVHFVAEQRILHRNKVDELFQNIEHCSRQIVDALLSPDPSSLMAAVNENGQYLEELGVVSPSVKSLLAQLRKDGFSCKISGAGGKTHGSGAVFVYTPDTQRYKQLNTLPYTWDLTTLSPQGVQIEERE